MGGSPIITVIGGPNGAGKTTIARRVLPEALGIDQFVNADAIAAGLSGFHPEGAAFAAGRIMLTRMKELAAARQTFAFESTLASRSFVPWLAGLKATGYKIKVLYVSLATPALAIARVKSRAKAGGHSVADEVIVRRFYRSARNLFELYMPLATAWRVYDNSGRSLELTAWSEGGSTELLSPARFRSLRRIADAQGQADD